MAVARLNKIKIFIHTSALDGLLRFLQEEGSVEIIDLQKRVAKDEYAFFLSGERPKETVKRKRAGGLDTAFDEMSWLIGFMALANKMKHYLVKKDEFETIAHRFDYRPVFEKAKSLESALKEIESSKKALIEKKESLMPWQGLAIDLADVCRVSYTVRGLGIIALEPFAALQDEARALGLDIHIDEITRTARNAYVFFVYLKEEEEGMLHLFKKHGLEHVYFPECMGAPAQLLASVEHRLKELESEKNRLWKEMAELASLKKDVFVLFDHLSNLARREDTEDRLISTERVHLVEGWVRKKGAFPLKAALEKRFSEVETFLEEPAPGENVPVILENASLIQPFEIITKIYGMPAYNEVDPTPFLAPFFFIFFGFCITDAGYGIVLACVSFWALHAFKMGWMGNRFFRLILYGGISTMVLGAITGGWFGNAIDMLAGTGNPAFLAIRKAKNAIILLDPMKEPMKLLVVALTLGVIQIWFGHVVAVYGNIKNRRYLDALMDQGSMFIFLFGFTGGILLVLNAVPKTLSAIFTPAAAIGAVAIVLTGGRRNPTIGSRLFYGVFALYNTFSGYLSDVLSYSRLWALGLVTGVMAATSNMMAAIIGGMVPYAGIVITAVILVGGHLLTLVMNLLGAFIHPMRLQFVEFFSKFFRGGGRDFRPLRMVNKYTAVE